MRASDGDCLKQLDDLLATSNQSWLFGAGICVNAGIPLMTALTARVLALAELSDGDSGAILKSIMAELPADAHIEHALSHLGDYEAIAERSRSKTVTVGSRTLKLEELSDLHEETLRWIADTIRWGYVPPRDADAERIGSHESPIVTVSETSRFVSALFNRGQAGVEDRRRPVRLFTINYDTLLEDALALGCFSYWDGFSGGAVAFRRHRYGEKPPDSGYRALVVKLHGSIDWYLGQDGRIWRVREGDLYPKRANRVLIYPQASKYVATQRDPFATQFDLFRQTVGSSVENVLAICGYSFGDDHINKEIELLLNMPQNKTTILAFSSQHNPVLKRWAEAPWSRRLYSITADGLFVGREGPHLPPEKGESRAWWKFDGVTKILTDGAEACVQ